MPGLSEQLLGHDISHYAYTLFNAMTGAMQHFL